MVVSKSKKHIILQVPAPYSPGSCFIATVVYGSPTHYKLTVFRRFRDNVLTDYRLGRKFISFYYRKAPKISERIRDKKLIKYMLKILIIEPVYYLIKIILF